MTTGAEKLGAGGWPFKRVIISVNRNRLLTGTPLVLQTLREDLTWRFYREASAALPQLASLQ